MSIAIQSLEQGIFTLPDLLSPAECLALIDRGEGIGFDRATVTTHAGQIDLPGVRNNDRAIWDDPHYAAALFALVREAIPPGIKGEPPVGLNERWRFYRYEPGQRFKKHRDGTLVLPPRVVGGLSLPLGRSQTTLMIYLNDTCVGGETSFFHEDGDEFLRVRPQTGMALCFPHHIKHEGCIVTEGQKYVLRTDILYKP